MAPWVSRSSPGSSPVFYLLVDFRHYRRNFRPYRKPEADTIVSRNGSFGSTFSTKNKLFIVRARVVPKSCLPNKVRRSEQGIAWRRKGSKRSQHLRNTTSSMTRPTILLPPMQCSDPYATDTTAPVISTRVQNDRRHLQSPELQPSAPSPGQVLYNSEDHSDIAFIVGVEEWRFPAHSFIIGKKEATLHALLKTADPVPGSPEAQGSNQETTTNPPIVLRLPGIQPDVFEQMLRYIYTRQVSLPSVESTLRLLHPSQTYQLPELTSRCLSFMSKHLTPSNVLLVLSHLLQPCIEEPNTNSSTFFPGPEAESDSHDNDNQQNELVFKCFLIVDQHADLVLQSEAFETLEHEVMIEIVKRDTLEVSTEAVVFDAIMRWACRACKRQRKELTSDNKSTVLGKALFLVRYLLLTPEEFLRGPVSQGVLSKDDKEALLSRITSSNSDSPVPLPDHWNNWKISSKRQRRSIVTITSPSSDRLSGVTDSSLSPTGSVLAGQPVTPSANTNKGNNGDRKKKSMSKKLLNGVGDLVICVIQLLD